MLAQQLGLTHFDTDDYHWFTDDVLPYRRRRNPDHRRQLMMKDFEAHPGWVLSGALCGWGDVFIPGFDWVVYCWAPVEVRLARIRDRELARYGAERLAPGGDLHSVFEKFCTWAAAYDEESGNIRSRSKEMEWLEQLTCPVLRLETVLRPEEMLEKVLEQL
jgi:adenylate kinase family enzyme